MATTVGNSNFNNGYMYNTMGWAGDAAASNNNALASWRFLSGQPSRLPQADATSDLWTTSEDMPAAYEGKSLLIGQLINGLAGEKPSWLTSIALPNTFTNQIKYEWYFTPLVKLTLYSEGSVELPDLHKKTNNRMKGMRWILTIILPTPCRTRVFRVFYNTRDRSVLRARNVVVLQCSLKTISSPPLKECKCLECAGSKPFSTSNSPPNTWLPVQS
jgi:hypothetical protein